VRVVHVLFPHRLEAKRLVIKAQAARKIQDVEIKVIESN
jgi:hypothetical protein